MLATSVGMAIPIGRGVALLLWAPFFVACGDEADVTPYGELAPSDLPPDAATADAAASAVVSEPGDASSPDASILVTTRDAAHPDAQAVPDSGRDANEPTQPSVTKTLEATIVVESGEVFDGKNERYKAGSALGDGSQSETQKPLFRLENGATLKNVVLGSPAADGIHTYGDATLSNIVWEDIGEDALTIKAAGTVTLNGGSAQDGSDKVFQINAASTFRVSHFKARNAGKFIRQNGGTTFRVEVFIERCDIAQMKESIFRTDSKVSTVSMTGTRYSQIGKELFMGVAAGNITQSNNSEY